MIKPYVTKNKRTIRTFKDDSVFLLSDAKNILHDKPIEKICRNRNMTKMSFNVRNGVV